jgi:hypothetical protein
MVPKRTERHLQSACSTTRFALGLTYHLTNGPFRVALLKSSWWLLTGESILNLLSDHPRELS